MKKLQMINLRFGNLLVISEHSVTKNGHTRYVCKCDCGNETLVLGTHLRQKNTVSCGCNRPVGETHKQWKGVGEISGDFWWSHVIRSANGSKNGPRTRRVKEITIDIKYGWDLFVKQNRKCALSGLELTFPKKSKDKDWTASLDRIDSSKGYIEGNVQWVHKDVNIMKNKFEQDNFIKICKLIAKNCAGGACEVK